MHFLFYIIIINNNSEWQDWVTDEEESIKIIKKAFDCGINFFE